MKEFNLEAAKAGAAVCTRDGRPVRLICTDAIGGWPVIVLIDENGREFPYRYREDGRESPIRELSDDLMMKPSKHEAWCNIYKAMGSDGIYQGSMFDSEMEAKSNISLPNQYVSTAHIEWEE